MCILRMYAVFKEAYVPIKITTTTALACLEAVFFVSFLVFKVWPRHHFHHLQGVLEVEA